MGRWSQTKYHRYSAPAKVRLTRPHHPLEGQVFEVVSAGPSSVVIRLGNGTSMRVLRSWTDADGPPVSRSQVVFTADSVRALLELVDALRKTPEEGASS
jgi:hypothetical protein